MKKKKILIFVLLFVIICLVSFVSIFIINKIKYDNLTSPYFLACDDTTLTLSGEDNLSISLPRGFKVDIKNKKIEINDVLYNQFVLNDDTYYVKDENIVIDRNDCVNEKELFTLRNHVLTKSYDSYIITGYVFKNEKVEVSGFHELLDDGSVDYYFVNNCGFIPSVYLSKEFYETALDASIYSDCYFDDGGDPTKIDYYKKDEISFENNSMPSIVKALYINAEAICAADEYIEVAKCTKGINAFVVDIKDCYVDTQLAYDSKIGKEYAPSTYNIPNSYDEYQENVKKLKDAGYYLIGRITAFKDDSFANDNPSEALEYNGGLYRYGYVNWPSIYSRKMWEYNVALALEAINDFGFNEIQFDYCRLPEDVIDVELKNTFNESRIEAICNFLSFAKEQIHNAGAYISCDVFGEISGNYSDRFSAWPTDYGQFWPAMSNIVDAISSMPYPDHFSNYSYDVEDPWINVYDLMYNWGKATYHAQEYTYYPAKCRTWIMAQDSNEYDVVYTADFIKEQIDGLKDANVFDGYLTWNAASDLDSYYDYVDVFD